VCGPDEFGEAAAEQGYVSAEVFTEVLKFIAGGASQSHVALFALRIQLQDYPEVAERVRTFDLEGK